VGPIDPELQRRALASGAALVSRVGDLHAEILGAAAELSDGPDDSAVGAALAAVEALHNQLAPRAGHAGRSQRVDDVLAAS
jgi:hypothetical protein